jgi:7,8-dihydroneopterin aldolase/epimerase/oxygenase
VAEPVAGGTETGGIGTGGIGTAGIGTGEPAPSLIELRGLRVLGRHGVSDVERSAAQPFELDIVLALDTTVAAASDDVADTVDYQGIAEVACEVVFKRSFRLLEALAETVAGVILDEKRVEWARIEWVSVSVRKLRPPVPFDLASAGVRITRSRS